MPFFALGSNGNGQLGIGSDEDTPRPTCVTASQDDLFDLTSTVSTWTLNTSLSPFHEFAAGGNHSAMITRYPGRRLFMTGSNKDGESLLQEPSFIFHAHDIEPDKQQQPPPRPDQLKQNPDIDPQTKCIGDKSLTRWRAVACGWAFTVAVTEPDSDREQDAHGSREQAPGHPQVFAWGSGSFGELGLGSGISKTGRKAIPVTLDSGLWSKEGAVAYEATKVRAGLRHVLLLLTESNASSHGGGRKRSLLLGWGSNRQGQIGILERMGHDQVQQPFTEKELRGKFMEPTRIFLPSLPLSSTNDTPMVVDMACGQNHSLILFSDGSVYSSGLNKYSQLGPRTDSGTEQHSPQPSLPGLGFRIGFEKVQGLPTVDLISCGWNHNGAMNSQDRTRLYLWGRNDHGQLGNGITSADSSPLVILRIPKPEGSGLSDMAFEEIESFSCGSEHCLAMTRSGDCYAWGWNEHGNCGTGPDGVDDRLDVLSPRKIHFLTSASSLASLSTLGWVAGGYGSSWIMLP